MRGKSNHHFFERLRIQWGVQDQEGIYLLARLSETQTTVARLHFDRGMQPFEIAVFLGWRDKSENFDARRVTVHLYEATRKLKGLGKSTDIFGY